MNEPKHLPQTTRPELLLCPFVLFKASQPGCTWSILLHPAPTLPHCYPPLLKPPLTSLRCSTHAQHVGSRVTPLASTARPRRRAGSAAFLHPRDSPSFANGTSAAVSAPRTASAALIGLHGCGLQKRSAELSEQPPQQPPTPPAAFLYIISVMLLFPPSHEIWEDSSRRGRRGS